MRKISFEQLAIGESVKVRKNTMCPDYKGLNISGWQGRIKDITIPDKGKSLINIQWDSITLTHMPDYFINQSMKKDLDFSSMNLYPEDVELTTQRDSKKEVERVMKKLTRKYSWIFLGPQGRRIQKVLDEVDEDDILDALAVWKTYLEERLLFPFTAEISESQSKGPLNYGDKITVKNITDVDDLYGIIVEVRFGRKKFHFPLCDLKTTDQKSQNATFLDDYSIWFSNR
ncbi:MAG: hypothetical protein KGY65_06685 [Candidatus Thermoplasmatota archaeon]|nr:hypothetical protein [Candidatus Thermoplasmatota archaeon]MBS3802419.1 hypothetical protein [Candidatus Thermoplasmatota archaeon]